MATAGPGPGSAMTSGSSSSSTKPRLTELVTRLNSCLAEAAGGAVDNTAGSNVLTAAVQMLDRMISPYDMTKVSVSQTQRILLEHAPDKAAFTASYDRLKSQGVRELDRYLMLVGRILQDPELAALLSEKGSKQAVPAASEQPAQLRFATMGSPATPASTMPAVPLPGLSKTMITPAASASHALGAPVQDPPQVRSEATPTSNMRQALVGTRSASMSAAVPSSLASVDSSLLATNRPHQVDDMYSTPRHASPITERMATQFEDVLSPSTSRFTDNKAIPMTPSWNRQRLYLTGEHLAHSSGAPFYKPAGSTKKPGGLPVDVQELVIIDDLLYVLLGVEGRYIHVRKGPSTAGQKTSGLVVMQFDVDESLDPSLLELVRRVLPICEYYVTVSRFVEARSRYEHGLVVHALAAAVRSLLKDYRIMVAQLEHQFRIGRLSLQGLWFYCQPTLSGMKLLASICEQAAVQNLFGAQVVNLLHSQATTMAGDTMARKLLQRLMQATCAPYFRMLERWVYEGVVEDPYGEFLIEERLELRKESLTEDKDALYWQQRYTVRSDVPVFLKAAVDMILTTGKYLNAIRECGKKVVYPGASEGIMYSHSERVYMEHIDRAHQFASRELLDLLMRQVGLMARLRSIKHYFLVDQGDFLLYFMDIAGEELSKPPADISQGKLQSLLELALRTSIAISDPHHEDLTCSLHKLTLVQHVMSVGMSDEITDLQASMDSLAMSPGDRSLMTPKMNGLEAFTLDYKVTWPLSLVVSRKAMVKYQVLFRHLFQCKHVERQLCNTWQDHQNTRALGLRGGPFSVSYLLCQRMLHCLQNVEYYMAFEVLEKNWHDEKSGLEARLRAATTVDEVIRCHDHFLDQCMKECMLIHPPILRRLERIKSTCLKFAAATQRIVFMPPEASPVAPALEPSGKSAILAEKQQRARLRQEQLNHAKAMSTDAEFLSTVRQLETAFNAQLKELIGLLYTESSKREPHVVHLANRLVGVSQGIV
eukprot:jgi/Chlat1/4365/Chrsp29S04513